MTVECILPLTPETMAALTDHNNEAVILVVYKLSTKDLITKFQLL